MAETPHPLAAANRDSDPDIPWLALALASSSPLAVAAALAACGHDPHAALRSLAGLEATALLDRAGDMAETLGRDEIRILTLPSPDYPALLLEIPDPPPVLFVRGELLPDDDPAVAIVGSRRATPYGQAVARYLGEELGTAGVTVISGLARGIDAAAHQGVLCSTAGRGIALLGHGADRIYPPEHRDLAAALERRGALVTEFPPGTAPLPANFPRRNRLISALARGVVVVEAATGSGSLITARLALDQGREVYAVPGPVTSDTSRGSNDLLRQGAHPVTSALDIVQEFPAEVRAQVARRLAARRAGPPPDLAPDEMELWESLDTAEPREVDALAAATGLGVARLVSALLGLELRGLVRALPGARYVRTGWEGDWTARG
jgi:DNA processing protein